MSAEDELANGAAAGKDKLTGAANAGKDKLNDAFGSGKDKLSNAAGSGKDHLTGGTDKLTGAASAGKDKLTGAAAGVGGAATGAAAGVAGVAGAGKDRLTGGVDGITGAATGKKGGGLGWLGLLIGILLIGFILWWLITQLSGDDEDGVEATDDTTAEVVDEEPAETDESSADVDLDGLQADVDSALAGSGVEGVTGVVGDDGYVTLTGNVAEQADSDAAEAAVADVENLAGIRNNIVVGDAAPAAVEQIECERGRITFDSGSAVISTEGLAEVALVRDCLTEDADVIVNIVGHTDTDGDDAGNQALSQSRAEAVRTYLIENGIDEARLTAEGRGESELLVDPEVTDEDKEANRRTEFIPVG